MSELYSLILYWLSSKTEHTTGKYLETEHYSISVRLHDKWVEIEDFIVKEKYRDKGYGQALVLKLSNSPINFKIITVISDILLHILMKHNWVQEPDSYNYNNILF